MVPDPAVLVKWAKDKVGVTGTIQELCQNKVAVSEQPWVTGLHPLVKPLIDTYQWALPLKSVCGGGGLGGGGGGGGGPENICGGTYTATDVTRTRVAQEFIAVSSFAATYR